LTFFLCSNFFSSFFRFLSNPYILSTIVDNKGHRDRCREVRHHVVGDYNFLTEKKKIFLKIYSSPPTFRSMLWI
jgi:hypothetical protein